MSARWSCGWVLLLAVGCGEPLFSNEEIANARLGQGLPSGFLLGAATAAHQVEGGNVNDWTDWEEGQFSDGRPHIRDGDRSGEAAASWEQFDADVNLLEELGANAYRFSVEWSRLEPERGVWRADVAARYLSWASELRARGIQPVVTLFHFTLPRWVAAQGGFENPQTLTDFEAFVGRVAIVLGSEVDIWCTLNEPNVYAVSAYLDGTFPPGKQDVGATAEVLARLIEAHATASKALRANDLVDADGDAHATWIGLVHHVRVFQAASTSPLDTAITSTLDDAFNEATPRALRTGRIQISFPPDVSVDRRVDDLVGSADFLGLNYYTRDTIRADLGSPSLYRAQVPSGRPRNDLGWETYPEGLYQFLKRFSKEGVPLYVTENGTADAQGDTRPAYLRAHFYSLQRAAEEGVDVRGYFHWSLMDNFEWAEGYAARFGLYRTDFDSTERTRSPTPAVSVFQDIARNLRAP